MTTDLPFGGNDWGNGYEVEGQIRRANPTRVAQIRPVSPAISRPSASPLRSGVDFSERDSENVAGVAIVTELSGAPLLPTNAVGKNIRYGDDRLTAVAPPAIASTARSTNRLDQHDLRSRIHKRAG